MTTARRAKSGVEPLPERGLPKTGDITTAVVTGGHPYHVPGFHHLLRTLPQVDAYPQHMEDYVANLGNVRSQYRCDPALQLDNGQPH